MRAMNGKNGWLFGIPVALAASLILAAPAISQAPPGGDSPAGPPSGGPSSGSATEYFSYNTGGQGEDIRKVISLIGKLSKVNIMMDNKVSGKTTLNLKDVYYEKALDLIAKTNGLVVRKEGNTYIVGQGRALSDAFDKNLVQTFKLNFAKPADVQKIVQDVYKATSGAQIKVSVDPRINAIIVQAPRDAIEGVGQLVKQLDVKVHQVLIEAKIVEVTTKGSRELGLRWKWSAGQAVGTGKSADTIFTTTEYQAKNANTSVYNPTMPAANFAEGNPFSFGDFFRGPLFFEATLQALETSGNAKVLSNPKIATLNGQKANIEVGSKIVYSTGGDQGAAEKDVGIKLQITPQINDEGWITAEIAPEVSSLEGFGPDGKLPIIGRRLANTTVRVKDGEEILIGGLIQEKSNLDEQKIPSLGNIPLLKMFFSNKKKTDDTQQLIILIKPSIIPEQES